MMLTYLVTVIASSLPSLSQEVPCTTFDGYWWEDKVCIEVYARRVTMCIAAHGVSLFHRVASLMAIECDALKGYSFVLWGNRLISPLAVLLHEARRRKERQNVCELCRGQPVVLPQLTQSGRENCKPRRSCAANNIVQRCFSLYAVEEIAIRQVSSREE